MLPNITKSSKIGVENYVNFYFSLVRNLPKVNFGSRVLYVHFLCKNCPIVKRLVEQKVRFQVFDIFLCWRRHFCSHLRPYLSQLMMVYQVNQERAEMKIQRLANGLLCIFQFFSNDCFFSVFLLQISHMWSIHHIIASPLSNVVIDFS